nr:hypothetical protein [Sneathiella glossodoripedis]
MTKTSTGSKRQPLDQDLIRCDACPVLCRIRVGQTGACDRYGNVDGVLTRMDPLVVTETAQADTLAQPIRPIGMEIF